MKLALKALIAILPVVVCTPADAQERAGVVTTLEGNVTVTRASLPQPAPLKFKDDIFVRDRITTGKDSVARILLGGRAVVTVREHSAVTITESPGVATVDVAAGRAAVAVAREKMRPGDLVQVKTPNAIAGIRGTVVVAEVFNASHSVVTVLKGTIDLTHIEGGRVVGAATIVNALQRMTIADGASLSAPQPIAPETARQLGQEFRLAPPRATPPAATAAVNAGEVSRVAKDLAALPRRADGERRLRANAVDDEAEDIISPQEGRGVPGREHVEKVGKPESGPKGRTETVTSEAPAVKSPGRITDPVNTVTEATKNSDKNGRGKGGRDR